MPYKITRPEGMPDWFTPGIWCEVSQDEKYWLEARPIRDYDDGGYFHEMDGISRWPYARPWIEPAEQVVEQVFDSRGLPLEEGDPVGRSDVSVEDAVNDIINDRPTTPYRAYHMDREKHYTTGLISACHWRYVVRAHPEDIAAEKARRAPKMRPMTDDECLGVLAQSGTVVKYMLYNKDTTRDWILPGMISPDDPEIDYADLRENWVYATLSPDGTYGEPKRFEKPVEEGK